MLRRLIHQKLEELQSGDLRSQEHGLDETSYFNLLKENDVYESFVKVVAEIWMEIENTRGEAIGCFEETRPSLEFYIRALKLSDEFIKNEIELHQNHCNDEGSGSGDEYESEGGENGKDTKQIRHNKMKSKSPIRTSPRAKKRIAIAACNSNSSSTGSIGNKKKGSKKSKSQIKVDPKRMKFEEQKERILSSLPSEVTDDFRQIFFASWEGQMMPVMQLSPYDLGPGKLRNDWFKMFQNVSCSIQLSQQKYRHFFPLIILNYTYFQS